MMTEPVQAALRPSSMMTEPVQRESNSDFDRRQFELHRAQYNNVVYPEIIRTFAKLSIRLNFIV
jgi:hypothetical protein